jgi:hypothetical protein
MQCPNCYTETSRLSRCPRCDTPLFRRPPAHPPEYGTAHAARRDGGYHGDGYDDNGDGYGPPAGRAGPEDDWEPSPQWQPDLPPDRRPGPWRDDPPRRPGHPYLIATIAGLLIGGVVAGVILLWPDGVTSGSAPNTAATAAIPGTPGAAGGAREQAAAINELLDEMAASRSALGPAIAGAARCDGVAAAIEELDRVREERRDQLARATELPVNALPEGAELREALTRAAGHSLAADEAFLAWAKANQGCTDDETPRDEHFAKGRDLSRERARPAKEDFAGRWNPIAADHGLPARSAGKF